MSNAKYQYINALMTKNGQDTLHEDVEIFKGVIEDDVTGEQHIRHVILWPCNIPRYEGKVGYNGNTGEMFWGTQIGYVKCIAIVPENGYLEPFMSVCDALLRIEDLGLHLLKF